MKYILEGKTPVPCPDLMKWATWYETTNRHVAATEIDDIRISTVFLGLDHRWSEGPPILFETMVFGGPLNDYQERYCTWDEALAGHIATVERVQRALRWPAKLHRFVIRAFQALRGS